MTRDSAALWRYSQPSTISPEPEGAGGGADFWDLESESCVRFNHIQWPRREAVRRSIPPPSLSPFSCPCFPLAKPNQKPEGKGAHWFSPYRPVPGTEQCGEWVWRDKTKKSGTSRYYGGSEEGLLPGTASSRKKHESWGPKHLQKFLRQERMRLGPGAK